MRQHKNHRGHFNHHANSRTGNGVAQHLFDFAPGTFNQTTGFVDFVDAGDHRQQNIEVASSGIGSQHGPHLDQKNFRLIEGYAYTAPAKARVFLADRHVRQLFVRPDVERTQRDRFFIEHLQHALILRNLLFLGRKAALQHKRDFSAIEPDAVNPATKLFFMLWA